LKHRGGTLEPNVLEFRLRNRKEIKEMIKSVLAQSGGRRGKSLGKKDLVFAEGKSTNCSERGGLTVIE